MKRFVALISLALLALCPVFVFAATDFPKGPITYIIPFNPGGQSDVEARMQQPYLEKMLGVPIVVNYMPGAGGALAWTKFSQMKPDGYTVCGINIPHIILQPLSQKDAAFKTEDLKPLALFESTPIGLVGKKGIQDQHREGVRRICQSQPGKSHRRNVGETFRPSYGLPAV